jgi:hypothetical protein
MQKTITGILLLLFLLYQQFAAAQGQPGESALGETMRSNGRIYVVVAVMLTILAGLILYLVRLDRKISKIEKDR